MIAIANPVSKTTVLGGRRCKRMRPGNVNLVRRMTADATTPLGMEFMISLVSVSEEIASSQRARRGQIYFRSNNGIPLKTSFRTGSDQKTRGPPIRLLDIEVERTRSLEGRVMVVVRSSGKMRSTDKVNVGLDTSKTDRWRTR